MNTLSDLLEQLADRGEAAAIIAHGEGPEAWSCARLSDQAMRLAAGLVDAGTKPGEVVGLLAPNRLEWPAALLGIVRAGGIALPLSHQITDQELQRVIEHSGCRRIITTAAHLQSFDAIEGAGDLEVVLLDEAKDAPKGRPAQVRLWGDLLSDAPADLPALEPDQPALLLYTSGTTGTPKGVPLSHANLISNIEGLRAAGLAGPDDRVLLPLPLHHAYPLTVGLLAPLRSEAAVVLPAGAGGPQIARALKDCRCTIMIGVPRLYEALVQGIERRIESGRALSWGYHRLLASSIWVRRRFGVRIGRWLFSPLHRRLGPDLCLLASGGARLEPAVAWALEGLGWQVLTGYGLTETAPILTFNPPHRARLESAGLPIGGVELRFEKQQDGESDQTAESDQTEVLARGPSLFAGYWQNPEATTESFTEDGFFRTGDLGHLDDDGYLHLEGRSKELIVLAGGKNIFPEDVETVLAASPLVREVAVLEHEGRLVGLFVPEIAASRERGTDELIQDLRRELERLGQSLPADQRLADLAVTGEALPRTQIGKLRRHELPEMFERAKSGDRAEKPSPVATAADRSLLETPPAGEIWTWLEQRFQGRALTLDTSPQFDLGLDSFDWMSLTAELEDRFGVSLSDEALGRITSLRGLLEEALAQQAAGGAAEVREPTAEQQRYLAPPGPAILAVAWLVYGLNRAVMRGIFRVRAHGRERLPEGGPLVIAPNHASHLDPFALAAVLSWSQLRRVRWAGGTGRLFRGPFTRLFSRVAQVVPVDPEHGLASTLAIGRAVLDQGGMLVWFPEGRRSTDGRLQPFLPGVGLLLERTGAAALPVFIGGSFAAWPPDRSWPRLHPIEIRFGEPLRLEDLDDDAGKPGDASNRHAAIAEHLEQAVARLGGKEVRLSRAA